MQKKPIEIISEPEPVIGDEELELVEDFDVESDVIQQKTTFVSQRETQSNRKVVRNDNVSVEVVQPDSVLVDAGDYEGEGIIVDKDVTHKIRIPIKIIKPEDVSHVNLNLRLEIECILLTETVKKQESKAEKLASRALEDFLLGKSKKRK